MIDIERLQNQILLKHWRLLNQFVIQRQELIEILEDEPDSADCPIGRCWWDDIPEEEFICQYT